MLVASSVINKALRVGRSTRLQSRSQFGHLLTLDGTRKAYFAELKSDAAQAAAKVLFEHLRAGPVTLLYGARDEQHNNAVALLAWLKRHQK